MLATPSDVLPADVTDLDADSLAPADEAPEARSGPPPRWRRPAAILFGVFLALLGLGLAGALGLLAWAARDLPTLRSLDDYAPPRTTVVYGAEGEVVARFAREHRTVVPLKRVPQIMIDAVVAAEDADFFEHEGIDYLGIARCAVKNAIAGRKQCGGSTITQQTVKTFFLNPKKTYVRKLREAILAKRLEDALSKDDILFLYLNQIYFGHGAYGIQEAAQTYFGIDVDDLDLEQAALLAGLPKSPSRLDPFRNPEDARARRRYVLERLRELGTIDATRFEAAAAAPLELDWDDEETVDNNNHYAAYVKELLVDRFGEEQTETGGLAVHTGQDPALQTSAETALAEGLRALDKRQGWRGPIFTIERNHLKAFVAALEAKLEGAAATRDAAGAPTLGWDLGRLRRADRNARPDELVDLVRFRPLEVDAIRAGPVVDVDDAAKQLTIHLGGAKVVVPMRTGLAWARPFRPAGWSARPQLPSDVATVGDIVDVRLVAAPEADGPYVGALEQEPLVEGAVVVMDPSSREVRALVGGYGVGAGRFNRAVRARRQPGSTFKPFVYAAAFDTGRFTPVSACLDAPRVYRDPWTGRTWKPENYGGRFDGEITLRRALTLSKNLCSVELIDEIGVDAVLDMAHRAGIESPLPRNLTLALGSGDVTPLEMVNAYATLATQGRRAEPVFIRKVVAPDGEVLFEHRATDEQTIRPEVAFQVTSLMQSVVEEGTARAVRELDRPVAGKTGTTNDARDAWFVGFTPAIVAGVWVGFDDNEPLGPSETGGRAAIPIWLDVMEDATADRPPRDFSAPARIVFARVEPESGKLASPDTGDARIEPFIAGTEPTEIFEEAAPVDRGIWEDYE